MREYLAFDNTAEAPHADATKQEKAATVFVSSNAYYGYQQPHVCGAPTPEESPVVEMQMEHEVTPVRLPCRKRTMENSAGICPWGECKKRRENDGGEYSQAFHAGIPNNNFQNEQNKNGSTTNHLINQHIKHQANFPVNQPNGNIYNLPHGNIYNLPNGHTHVENTDSQMEVTSDPSNNNNEKLEKHESTQRKGRVKNFRLEEDLLRETHGCTYYHWIGSAVL